MGIQSKKPQGQQSQHSDLEQLMHRLVRDCQKPEQFVELYYWSMEPELLETVRQIVALPDDARSTLQAFFRLAASNAEPVSVTVAVNGDVTLSSPTVTDLLITMMRTSGQDEPNKLLH